MGRADYRGGRAPIKTAGELADLLPIPILLMVLGYAGPIYPMTDRSNPAPAVGIVGTTTIPDSLRPQMSGILPVWVHWTQWRDVVVPLVNDERITDWSGVLRDLGDLLALLEDVRGPDGEIIYPEGSPVGSRRNSTNQPGGLYIPLDGNLTGLVEQVRLLVAQQSEAAGY